MDLDKLLASWPKERRLYFCDEGGDARPLADAARGASGPAAILTGPEGGFDPAERELLRALLRDAGDFGPAHPARRHRGAGGVVDLAVSRRRLALRLRLPSARDRRRPARRSRRRTETASIRARQRQGEIPALGHARCNMRDRQAHSRRLLRPSCAQCPRSMGGRPPRDKIERDNSHEHDRHQDRQQRPANMRQKFPADRSQARTSAKLLSRATIDRAPAGTGSGPAR